MQETSCSFHQFIKMTIKLCGYEWYIDSIRFEWITTPLKRTITYSFANIAHNSRCAVSVRIYKSFTVKLKLKCINFNVVKVALYIHYSLSLYTHFRAYSFCFLHKCRKKIVVLWCHCSQLNVYTTNYNSTWFMLFCNFFVQCIKHDGVDAYGNEIFFSNISVK